MRRPLSWLAGAAVLLALWAYCDRAPEVRNPKPVSGTIVCFGDSLTYGTGAEPAEAYPAQLSALIGRPVVNAGVPGDTTAQALERLEAGVVTHKPGYVLVTLGGNDLRQRVAPAQIEANLRRIVETCQAAGALVIIGGLEVPLLGGALAAVYAEVARDLGAVLIEDIYAGIRSRPGPMSDAAHPNAAGFRRLAAKFHAALKPYL